MKLNPDCIRDILITVEDVCDFDTPWTYTKDDSLPSKLKGYSHTEIIYHIRQAEKNNLIEPVVYADGGDYAEVCDLTPAGHQFLANVRSDTVWNKVKTICGKMGSTSLQALMQISTGVISEVIKIYLTTGAFPL